MYDVLSSDYDRFVNWPARLGFELPFLLQQLHTLGGPPARVLDAACGTGMHSLALAQRGYTVAGADLSAGMVAQARQNAAAAGVEVRFEAAGFGELAGVFGREAFDAVLCLGNSLPHVLTPATLQAALADFAACLRPGGLLLVQNRNFDAVMAHRERWMDPEVHREGDTEWLFVRFYDLPPVDDRQGLITFNILTLTRSETGWRQQVTSTLLRPLLQAELAAALPLAGFEALEFYGSMNGAPFEAQASGNLVLRADRSKL